jgi:hypothetical protein
MKKPRSVLLGCMILLIMCLFGCGTTHTFVTYDGTRLPQDRVATVEFSQNYLLPLFDNPRVKVLAVDDRNVDSKNDSKWSNNLGPANIELLPGNHSLHIEYFSPAHQGGTISYPSGGSIIYQRVPPSPRKTIAIGTVAFTAEAGHKYVLTVDRGTRGGGILLCTIEDSTTGKVVYPPQRDPITFSLSEIPKDKAVVCFYREWKLLSAAVTFYISESAQAIGKLDNSSLFYHITTPGSHSYTIRVGPRTKLTNVNLMPGVISYLRASVDETLTLVTETEGSKEIRGLDVVK